MGPVLGSLIGIMRRPSEMFMYNMLAFAAGVMLAISFLELIPQSIELSSIWLCSIGIIVGASIMYLVDKLIPHIHPDPNMSSESKKLHKTAFLLIVGIFIHNFPEGMTIAVGAAIDVRLAMVIAIAIAVHNIPEGICTSAPYYYCTKKRLKSFLISSSTAIPIVLGFFVASFLFRIISESLIGIIVAITAGVMIYISGDELIPTSCVKNGKRWGHTKIFSLIVGVVFVVLLSFI